MKRILSLTLCFVMVMAAGTALASAKSKFNNTSDLHFVVQGENVVLSSTTSSQSLLMRESAGPDTFDLYGGARNLLRDPDGIPGNGDEYVEGKFQDATGFSPRGVSSNPGDWTGVDLTDGINHWFVDGYNAENLNSVGPGNLAAWCGVPANVQETLGWSQAPGYGNNWDDILIFESAPLANPGVAQTVVLDFFYNYDVEPGFDYFTVDYDSAGNWTNVLTRTGTNKVAGSFAAPGAQFSTTPGVGSIVYVGNDYSTDGRVKIRLRVTTDGAASDADGDYPSDGAAQVDQISVTIPSLGTFPEDFQSGALAAPGTANRWVQTRSAFAGNFADVFAAITDINPCGENRSPMAGFIDYGQAPDNGPGLNGTVSTGGSTSLNWTYGIPDGYVVNYNGGISDNEVGLNNEIWSPEFDWDLTGTADDGASGANLGFTVWRHNPLLNGLFYIFHVRSFAFQPVLGANAWGPWQDFNFVYYSNAGEYLPTLNNITAFLPSSPVKCQIALGVVDLAATFGFPGADATPAPMFDSVRFYKYSIGGIALTTREIDLSNDSFPVNGSIAVGDQAARDALDVRFDMARDISTGDLNIPGDSITVQATAVIPGTALADLRMVWSLRLNKDLTISDRVLPAGASSSVDGNGYTIWTGSVVMPVAVNSNGIPTPGTYFGDLPDENFMYAGDILHYYIQATDGPDLSLPVQDQDDGGRTTTLPGNTSGFGVWEADGSSSYARVWTVRCLPTLTDAGAQPSILVWNDFGRRGNEAEFTSAFRQLGLFEGIDWDSYTTNGPSSLVGNGLGSAGVDNSLGDRRGHGASAGQLDGYSTIFYLSGDLSQGLISDGTDLTGNSKAADLQTMSQWKDSAGSRNTVYFGDNVAYGLTTNSPSIGGPYVSGTMGVTYVSRDVRGNIDGQTAPVVRSTGLVTLTGGAQAFQTEFIAFGGCFGINQFDEIQPGANSVASHGFVNPSNVLYNTASIAAGVVYDRLVGVNSDRKVDITFPFGDLYVYDNVARAASGVSARTLLLEEILNYLGEDTGSVGNATAAPALRQASLSLYPNPFNPKTAIQFALPKAGMNATVKVFNVRGELVKTLHDGVSATADLNLEWNGTDDRGAGVASGLYLVKAITEGFEGTKKAVLVK